MTEFKPISYKECVKQYPTLKDILNELIEKEPNRLTVRVGILGKQYKISLKEHTK